MRPFRLAYLLISLSILVSYSEATHAGVLRDRIMERLGKHTGSLEDGYDESGSITLPAGATVKRNIPYGDDNAQQMDVYIPPNAKQANVIFMVHGGGWRHGDKAMARVVQNKINHWLPKGYLFISINYRMLPDADPMVQAQDVAKALAKAQSLASSWGGEPKKFILMGHSAGAHLIALVGVSPSLYQPVGISPWLGSVLLDSAGYDIEASMNGRHMKLYDDAFGQNPSFWKQTSPYAQLQQKTPPVLAVCSSSRPDHPCDQASKFVDKLTSLGTRASTLPEALSHKEINENLGLASRYTDDVDAFIKALSAQAN